MIRISNLILCSIFALLLSACGEIIDGKTITKANYLEVEEGMSYAQVIRIIGFDGEEMASSNMAGVPGVMEGLSTKMYSWQNSDGTNMNATFQNDRLVAKAQFGLK